MTSCTIWLKKIWFCIILLYCIYRHAFLRAQKLLVFERMTFFIIVCFFQFTNKAGRPNSLHKICENTGQWKRVSENPYSRIFYTVRGEKNYADQKKWTAQKISIPVCRTIETAKKFCLLSELKEPIEQIREQIDMNKALS